jgi:membrane fusion protein, multidrug efflux system
MQVAALDADDKVALKPVVLGRNLGNRVEIESGLSLSDRLIDNPLESTQTGDRVNIATSDAKLLTPVSAAGPKADPNKRPSL